MSGTKGRSGGHNRKSAEIHILEGTYRGDRHGPLALVADPARVPAGGCPAPPPGLGGDSRALWNQLMAEYDGWSAADLMLLQLGLEQLDRTSACRSRIAQEGILVRGPRGGLKPHPLLRVERDAGATVLAVFRQLGLPAATAQRGA
jgi:P27 family predicted phage terminase small subunit